MDEEKLLTYLKENFDDPVVGFTDEDTKGGGSFIDKNGKYQGFISGIDITQITRAKATKTKPIGSKFQWLNVNFIGKKNADTGEEITSTLRDGIRYESGFMRDFEAFCIATRCHSFKKGDNRIYYPQADHEHGGAVGMPVTIEVKMEPKQKRVKVEATGEYIDVTDEEGKPVYVNRPQITAYHAWETDERYTPPQEEVPDADLGLDDTDF